MTYAQDKEDLILLSMLHNVEKGIYVDVGANDPDFLSVTKLFYELGWHGINIEPLRDKYRKLMEKRPRDYNVNLGVGSKRGKLTLHCLDTGSTFSDEIVNYCHYENYPTMEVEVCLLTDIVYEFFPKSDIHFCKIDVEGFEKEVLAGIQDWEEFRPWVYCIESTIPDTEIPCYEDWEYMLLEHDYEFVLMHGINRYYVDKRKKNVVVMDGLIQFKQGV